MGEFTYLHNNDRNIYNELVDLIERPASKEFTGAMARNVIKSISTRKMHKNTWFMVDSILRDQTGKPFREVLRIALEEYEDKLFNLAPEPDDSLKTLASVDLDGAVQIFANQTNLPVCIIKDLFK